jgi:hypothetical protein
MARIKTAYTKVMDRIDKEKRAFNEFCEGLSDTPICEIYSIMGNYEKAEERMRKIQKRHGENKGPDDLPQIGDYEIGDMASIPIVLALAPIAYCTARYREFKELSRQLRQEPEITVYRFDEKPKE